MPTAKIYTHNIINMNILDIEKKKKLLEDCIYNREKYYPLTKKKIHKLFYKAHSNIEIDINTECVQCGSSSKGGYQYIIKPSTDKFLCLECKTRSQCKRCQDQKKGLDYDILKTYRDQTNQCRYCALTYFIKELDFTELEFEAAYNGLNFNCKKCIELKKACPNHTFECILETK
jgi:hypothetical protein